MAVGDYGRMITLQDAAAVAADGIVVSIGGLTSVVVQITGTYTGMQVNFEASVDGALTWAAVALLPIGSTTPGTLVATPAAGATGLYRLQDARGLTHIRARVSGSGTGAVTVTAYSVPWQAQR